MNQRKEHNSTTLQYIVVLCLILFCFIGLEIGVELVYGTALLGLLMIVLVESTAHVLYRDRA